MCMTDEPDHRCWLCTGGSSGTKGQSHWRESQMHFPCIEHSGFGWWKCWGWGNHTMLTPNLSLVIVCMLLLNHRIIENLNHLVPSPLPWAGTPHCRPRCPRLCSTCPWTLSGMEHYLFWWPVPVPHHSHKEELLPNISLQSPLCQFTVCYVVLVPWQHIGLHSSGLLRHFS